MPQTAAPLHQVMQICGRVTAATAQQALDADHAQDIARAQHPTGRLSAVPAELLDGQDPSQAAQGVALGGGVSWVQLQHLVQHPNPDPPQQSHRHNRQGKHSEALKPC